jgi:hypothetical protein
MSTPSGGLTISLPLTHVSTCAAPRMRFPACSVPQAFLTNISSNGLGCGSTTYQIEDGCPRRVSSARRQPSCTCSTEHSCFASCLPHQAAETDPIGHACFTCVMKHLANRSTSTIDWLLAQDFLGRLPHRNFPVDGCIRSTARTDTTNAVPRWQVRAPLSASSSVVPGLTS